jgi:hypothetical protein
VATRANINQVIENPRVACAVAACLQRHATSQCVKLL